MSTRPQPASPDPSSTPRRRGERLFTVTAVNAMVKNAITDALPATLHVVGQLSNFKRHGSGHLYFTLKDDESELSCVMWRSAAGQLAFKPTDGLEVVAGGYIDVFERAGRYQLYVRKLEPRGIGALELAFRQLRDRLQREGLFDPRHKKSLPPCPQRVAVLTSPTGAAVRDVLQTLERRAPYVEVLLYPVTVQGPSAAAAIASALVDLNRKRESLGGIDALILTRGGGSLEDLWAFNEEIVARAVFASAIPVISAVGHETDVSISDLVADVRAATPTAAAEIVAPDRADLASLLDGHRATLARFAAHRLEVSRMSVVALTRRRTWAEPLWLIESRAQMIDELEGRLCRAMLQRLRREHGVLRSLERIVARIRPDAYMFTAERRLSQIQMRLHGAVARRTGRAELDLARNHSRLAAGAPKQRLGRAQERFAEASRRLQQSVQHRLRSDQQRLIAESARLHGLSHRRTLQRGFSITRLKKGRKVIRDPDSVVDGALIVTETAAGEFESRVCNREQLELFE